MVEVTPPLAKALKRAVAAYQSGQWDEAHRLARAMLDVKGDCFDALRLTALVYTRQRRFDEALASYDRVLVVRPHDAEAFNNRGNILKELKRFDEALASYDRALALRPDFVEALYNRGNTLLQFKRFDEALASYDRTLVLRPHFAEALYNRGNTLKQLKRFDEALTSFDRAVALRPDFAEAFNNRGNTLQELKRFDEALSSYDRALALRPDFAGALYNRGATLHELKRLDEALASYDRTLALRPDYTEALNNRGNVLKELNRFAEALASYDRALALRPDYTEALNNRGNVLKDLKRFDEALTSYEQALVIEPNHLHAFDGTADTALKICDWAKTAEIAGKLNAHVAERASIIAPFVLLGYSSDAALHLKCAQSYIADRIPALPRPLWNGAIWRHDKIKIAYLSADFRLHATAFLIAELLEFHNRSRFEVVGLSFGTDDNSDIRADLIKSFDQFHDVRFKSDLDAAKLVHELKIDIAVDLKGYTQDARPGILAHRPAPVQVNYLGFPGTMGADFIDYVIADKIVLPFDQQPYYTEKIVHLPDCYQVNDTKRRIAGDKPTRLQAGLPESGFVFCCFNDNYKITPPIFDVWMRLLRLVDGSVLWLLSDNASAEQNLRKQAAGRGIDPSRLVFAKRIPLKNHLPRHHLADLFLDTIPYNAHTTASDALWMGLPLVTCQGKAFAGRVAASLLNAVGLPELVTHSLAEYEALAFKLATEGSLLQSIRQKLARNKESYPLFDTKRFRSHLEAAYTTMWKIYQRGESPRSFDVSPITDTEGINTPPQK